MTARMAVDVGGTFSDLVFLDPESGEVSVAKALSRPAAPEAGVLAVIEAHLQPGERARSSHLLHGTTIGLNALIERRGARVGLLATRGFRDVLELRRGDRDRMYDLRWRPPPPLVPRRLRLPVTERVAADGTVLTPLVEADVRAAAALFAELEVESIAVAFLNAYANPAHELAAAGALRALGFKGSIVLSHLVSREFREYERTSTAVVDAYIRPAVGGYLARLESGLRAVGFGGALLVTRSGGGALPAEEAAERPVETIMSGPVGGAMGAGDLCRRMGIELALTIDVGGTSTDVSLVEGGKPRLRFEAEVLGMALQSDWVDVRSVGAGGGSIVELDAGGGLRVGPRSAGSDPGPAAYGRGGRLPSVTDAATVLGMLGPGLLAGGVRLRPDLARAALAPIAAAVGLEVETTAAGVIEVAVAQMAAAIRSVSVEQGRDPRQTTLLTFGGAGPLFGCLLVDEFAMPAFIVPPMAGNFSAWGLLNQPITRSAARTFLRPLDAPGLEAALAAASALARGLSAPSGPAELSFDLRYRGQEHAINVPLASATPSRSDVEAAFVASYERAYGHTMDAPLELVNVRVHRRQALPELALTVPAAGGPPAPSDQVSAYSFARRRRVAFRVAAREALSVGTAVAGPAIITEATATTYLDAGFEARVHALGALIVSRSG